ncbi:CU044_5270 family protein [Nonomuraea sp. NPDC050404]|uniref:CU044_5270 family protein n=1 Tax=Nonomuraea sp. NPDC050404 TaxID=3155783 RepID=UPI0033EC5C66
MDELKELGRLWADMPEASEQDLAASRAALLSRAGMPQRPRPRIRFRRPALRVGLVGALATGLSAVIVAAQVGLLGAGSVANAQDLLKRASAAAAGQEELVPGPGQYVHTKMRVRKNLYTRDKATGKLPLTVVHGNEERWDPADANRPWLMREQSYAAEGPALRHLWDRGVVDILHEPSYCPGPRAYARLGDWPSDVGQVRAKLVAQVGEDPLSQWNELKRLVKESVVRPSLSAALYRVVAEVDGIELVPEVVDVAGRPGMAVAMDEGGGRRSELIFDRSTYRYLGERTVNVADVREDTPNGTITQPKGATTGTAVLGVELVPSLPAVSDKVSRMKIPC